PGETPAGPHSQDGCATMRLHHWAKTPDNFLQTPGDLAQRANLHCFQQRREKVFTALDDFREFVQCAFGFLRVLLFEFRKPIDLQLLFAAPRARKFHVRNFVVTVAVAIQSDDWTSASVNW